MRVIWRPLFSLSTVNTDERIWFQTHSSSELISYFSLCDLKAHWFLLLKMTFAIWANGSLSPTNNDCEWNYFWKCGCIVMSGSRKGLPPQSSAVFPLTSRNPFWPPRSSAADTPGRPLASSARPTPPEIKNIQILVIYDLRLLAFPAPYF